MRTSLRNNRSGISPLIATVLLLAFAVAIGTMGVSYIVDATKTDACSHVKIAVQDGVPVCYRDGRVSMILTNRDQGAISSASLKFVNANGDFVEQHVALALTSGSASKIDVDYQTVYPTGVKITVTPAILENGNERYCFQQEITTSMQACG